MAFPAPHLFSLLHGDGSSIYFGAHTSFCIWSPWLWGATPQFQALPINVWHSTTILIPPP